MSKSDKYIHFVLYDAEMGKRIGKTITKSHFKDQDEIDTHIQSVRALQKKKNADYKKKMRMEIVEKAGVINELRGKVLDHLDNFILDKGTGNSTVVFGASKRGKSTLMMRLYNEYFADDKKYISSLFTGNKQIHMYKKAKRLLVSEGFGKQSEKYIMMQKYINSNTDNRYKFLNLFDDIIDAKHKKLVNNLILTYRNANISTIMCLQYPFLFSKMNRGNVNNILIFACNNDAEIKDMIDIFLKSRFLNAGLRSLSDQLNFFKEVTANYGFFYINNIHNVMTLHRIINK
jgi:hypothetical protein